MALPGASDRPWRLDSQFWVAFFGGPVALGVLAILNARRLRLAQRSLLLIAAGGVVGFGLACAVGYGFVAADLDAGARLATQIGGVLAYIPIYRLQRSGDRIYRFYADEPDEQAYESLWGPGLLHVLLIGIPTVVVVGFIVTALAE